MTEIQGVQGGLFPDPADSAEEGDIEAAAKRTIAAMREFGALDGTHDLKVQLIVTGSRVLDREFRRDKASVAATTLFSKVVDIADGLPTIQKAVNDKFAELADRLADAD